MVIDGLLVGDGEADCFGEMREDFIKLSAVLRRSGGLELFDEFRVIFLEVVKQPVGDGGARLMCSR